MKIILEFTPSPIVIPPVTFPDPEDLEIGASLDFLGIVRQMEDDRALAGLGYEAYEPMARLHLQRICETLGTQHPCKSVLFIHRLGWVPVGEVSLFIRVQAAHRGPAFAYSEELIHELKRSVPIWKKCS